MKIVKTVHILMPLTIMLSFLWAPATAVHGELSRIVYYHVSLAWISVLAFVVAGIFSIAFLYDKNTRYPGLDHRAYNSALIGFVFVILATLSGALWAKLSWNSFWNWDPRQASIVILLLVYTAYFSLHSSLAAHNNRGKIAAVYLVFAMATVPFLMFIVPRMYDSLHPQSIINARGTVELDSRIRMTLALAVFSFTLLYVYLMQILTRMTILRKKREESYEV